jgi:hypothetical protein
MKQMDWMHVTQEKAYTLPTYSSFYLDQEYMRTASYSATVHSDFKDISPLFRNIFIVIAPSIDPFLYLQS